MRDVSVHERWRVSRGYVGDGKPPRLAWRRDGLVLSMSPADYSRRSDELQEMGRRRRHVLAAVRLEVEYASLFA